MDPFLFLVILFFVVFPLVSRIWKALSSTTKSMGFDLEERIQEALKKARNQALGEDVDAAPKRVIEAEPPVAPRKPPVVESRQPMAPPRISPPSARPTAPLREREDVIRPRTAPQAQRSPEPAPIRPSHVQPAVGAQATARREAPTPAQLASKRASEQAIQAKPPIRRAPRVARRFSKARMRQMVIDFEVLGPPRAIRPPSPHTFGRRQ